MSQSKSDIYCIVAIIFFTVLAYGNSFTGAFIFDDTLNILHNRFITLSSLTFSNLTNVISESWSKSRPLPNLTFALNYYFHGQDTWGYHLFNLAIHTCTAVILFFVCTTTLSLSSLSDKYPKQSEIAFIAALLWAVHPIQTNGVTYIVQRMTSMCTLFYLLSLLLYIFARLNKGHRVKQIFQYGLSVVFGILALISKEIALFLPITIIVYFRKNTFANYSLQCPIAHRDEYFAGDSCKDP